MKFCKDILILSILKLQNLVIIKIEKNLKAISKKFVFNLSFNNKMRYLIIITQKMI